MFGLSFAKAFEEKKKSSVMFSFISEGAFFRRISPIEIELEQIASSSTKSSGEKFRPVHRITLIDSSEFVALYSYN